MSAHPVQGPLVSRHEHNQDDRLQDRHTPSDWICQAEINTITGSECVPIFLHGGKEILEGSMEQQVGIVLSAMKTGTIL